MASEQEEEEEEMPLKPPTNIFANERTCYICFEQVDDDEHVQRCACKGARLHSQCYLQTIDGQERRHETGGIPYHCPVCKTPFRYPDVTDNGIIEDLRQFISVRYSMGDLGYDILSTIGFLYAVGTIPILLQLDWSLCILLPMLIPQRRSRPATIYYVIMQAMAFLFMLYRMHDRIVIADLLGASWSCFFYAPAGLLFRDVTRLVGIVLLLVLSPWIQNAASTLFYYLLYHRVLTFYDESRSAWIRYQERKVVQNPLPYQE